MSPRFYPGIDAHVNSMLQTPGTPHQPAMWHSFHHDFIAFFTAMLNTRIRPHYVARSELSLQTRGRDFGSGVEILRPIPDVTVFQRAPGAAMTATAIAAPRWRARLADILDPIPQPFAVIIYEQLGQAKPGRAVARIELLSPTNKPRGSHYQGYAVKRVTALETGIPLIEIDFLHESPPLIRQLGQYPDDEESYPYHILVSDPRPDWGSGEAQDYSFRVNEAIALFSLPLAKDDSIVVDLKPVYQQTLVAGSWEDDVDYTQPPERFDTYSADDQAFIRQMMAQI
jgi:hypothetical protein